MVSRTATAVIVTASTVDTEGVELTRYYGPFLPHVGSATHETRRAMAELALDNLERALLGGTPRHMVNPQVWRGAGQ